MIQGNENVVQGNENVVQGNENVVQGNENVVQGNKMWYREIKCGTWNKMWCRK